MNDKINPEKLNIDGLKAKAQDALNDPEKLRVEVLSESKSFYEENKQAIGTFVFCAAAYFISRRMVKKVVRKELTRALTQMGFAIELMNDPSTGNILVAQIQDFDKWSLAK